MALALGLSPHYFEEAYSKPRAHLRLIWYPSSDAPTPHAPATDHEGFTILQRGAGGGGDGASDVEIELPSGEWCAISRHLPPSPAISLCACI